VQEQKNDFFLLTQFFRVYLLTRQIDKRLFLFFSNTIHNTRRTQTNMNETQAEKKRKLHNNHVDKRKKNEREKEENVYLIPTKLSFTDI